MTVEKGIPEFRLILGDFVAETSYDPDTIFYYLIETYKGPINTPVIISGIEQGQIIFGVDFSPFFYQNPTGVIGVVRVGTKGEKQASMTYTVGEDEDEVLKVTSVDYGTDEKEFRITPATTGTGKYNVLVRIPGYGSRTYSGLNSIKDIVKRVSDKFSNYITFEYTQANEPALATDLNLPVDFTLSGGSNGFELSQDGSETATAVGDDGKLQVGYSIDYAYRQALLELETIDLFGIDTLSDSTEARVALIDHLNVMLEPEVGKERFIVLNSIFHAQEDPDNAGEPMVYTLQDLMDDARLLNHSHILYIGQGVDFDGASGLTALTPTYASMLYTGKRSQLQYGEPVGGGEDKKGLRGVVNTHPLTNDGYVPQKQDIVDLNESGVIQFKKEYSGNINESLFITILEGVTTDQNSYELSQEQVMSIYIVVSKRLARIARPFIQRKLTSDLQATFETALTEELSRIKDTDATLIDLESPAYQAYVVKVQAVVNAESRPDGRLKRNSKFIAQVWIVPSGSLRQIDLGTIVV